MKCERCDQFDQEGFDVDGRFLCRDCAELYNRECVYGEDHGFRVRTDFLIARKPPTQKEGEDE